MRGESSTHQAKRCRSSISFFFFAQLNNEIFLSARSGEPHTSFLFLCFTLEVVNSVPAILNAFFVRESLRMRGFVPRALRHVPADRKVKCQRRWPAASACFTDRQVKDSSVRTCKLHSRLQCAGNWKCLEDTYLTNRLNIVFKFRVLWISFGFQEESCTFQLSQDIIDVGVSYFGFQNFDLKWRKWGLRSITRI